jgi:uncharacterized protein YgbK (DUF1537 family)
MLLGVIADDFTGGSDVANTLARGGMATRLFIGASEIDSGCDAGVVALKTRSGPPADAVRQALEALAPLHAAGCRQILFKICSTFDSTSDGNIGPVAEALAEALGATAVAVCPAFPATGRTVYQGHLFVGDRPLHETGMARHPLTPMTDPDIRRWLAMQCRAAPGHIALATVRAGAAAIRAALDGSGRLLNIVDATDDSDLRAIGAAVAGAPLLVGASGLALGLPANFGAAARAGTKFRPNGGPALILAGSCSLATQEQVAMHRTRHPTLEIGPQSLADVPGTLAAARALRLSAAGGLPLITSTSATPVRDAAVADRLEALFGDIARKAVADGVSRLVVAGGETSGAVVTALGLMALELGPEIDPGVPAMSAGGLALALKSGNFGAADFLERAAGVLGGE